MEDKIKEIVEIKQRSLAEENQKTLEVLKERYFYGSINKSISCISCVFVSLSPIAQFVCIIFVFFWFEL